MSDILDPQNKNARSIIQATKVLTVDQKKGLYFLLLNMPETDLNQLSASVLKTNIQLAYRAMSEVSWRKRVPEDVFLNYVLPYANLDESREDWRTGFYKRYIDLAKACKTPGEVAQKLNEKIFTDLNVRYHATKRPKPNQSPSESIKASYASCTGLSILLVDACRAVGVPARIAGTAMWFDNSGNHTWVEVWDDGEWKYIGAAEPGPFNQTWFSGKAAKADSTNPRYAIYAVKFESTDDHFVLSWDRDNDSINAANVTGRYVNEKDATLSLYPKPTEAKLKEGTLVLPKIVVVDGLPMTIRLTGSAIEPEKPLVGDQLIKILKSSGVEVRMFFVSPNPKIKEKEEPATIQCSVDENRKELGDNGYDLTVTPDKATIVAKTKKGIENGVEILMQLIPETRIKGQPVRIPCVKVRDIK